MSLFSFERTRIVLSFEKLLSGFRFTELLDGPIAQSRLERTPDKREVVGSIPTRPTTFQGV